MRCQEKSIRGLDFNQMLNKLVSGMLNPEMIEGTVMIVNEAIQR